MCSLAIGRRVLRLSVLDTGWSSASARRLAANMVDREHRRSLAWDSWRETARARRSGGSSSPPLGLRRTAVESGNFARAPGAHVRLSCESVRHRLKRAHPQIMDCRLTRNFDA